MTTVFVSITTTVDSGDAAEKLAALIVDSRLAACVQFAPIRSVYRWQGAVESADEWRLTAKTRRSLARKLVSFIRKNHTYELPEIVVTRIEGGLAGYLEWVKMETAGIKPRANARGTRRS